MLFLRSRRFYLSFLVVALSALFSLFQNMSPFDVDDIRRLAPKEPAPVPQSFDYLPKVPNARSPQALGEEILRHNLSGPLKQLGDRLEDWTTVGSGESSNSSGGEVADRNVAPARSYKLRAGVMGKAGVGVLYERDFKVKCEYSPLGHGFQVRFDQPLSTSAHLTVQHNSEVQQSSIGFSYQW
jgi:hypothetical protein